MEPRRENFNNIFRSNGDSGTWTYKIIAEKEIRRHENALASSLKTFIEENELNFKAGFIVLTVQPEISGLTAASVAAGTGISVISGLSAMDMAPGATESLFQI